MILRANYVYDTIYSVRLFLPLLFSLWPFLVYLVPKICQLRSFLSISIVPVLVAVVRLGLYQAYRHLICECCHNCFHTKFSVMYTRRELQTSRPPAPCGVQCVCVCVCVCVCIYMCVCVWPCVRPLPTHQIVRSHTPVSLALCCSSFSETVRLRHDEFGIFPTIIVGGSDRNK